MRIVILAPGTRGDVQPLLALAIGLNRAGHSVGFVTHSTFESFVTTHGVEYHRLAGNPLEDLLKEQGLEWLESGDNPIRFARNLLRISWPLIPKMFHDSWQASRDAEMILFHGLAPQGYHIAEKLKIPSFLVSLQPFGMTADFPMILFPQSWRLGKAFNRFTYRLGEQIFWQPIRTLINRWRREELNLPPFAFLGDTRRMRLDRQPVLYGFSRHVIPKPADWGDWYNICGYWFLERPPEWQPHADLIDFIESGPAPVYIGFGSMTDRDPKNLLKIALESLAISKVRGILHRGWAGLDREHLPDNVLLIDAVPHEWLFPQMAAVVHHGGAGTTASGLRAGVPTVTVPFFADQPWWGDRIHRLGAGPPPIPRKKLTAAKLAEAIHLAVESHGIKTQSTETARLLSGENGIARAVELIAKSL